MRHVFFLTFFISFSAYAQLDTGTGALGPCTDLSFTNGGTYNCSTLTLSASPAFIPNSIPLIIKVTGAVTIDGTVNLNGIAGITNTFDGATTSLGGEGGPGNAGDGGGNDAATLFPGTDASVASGINANGGGIACEDGGGGGGFADVGVTGLTCGGGNGPGAGGSIVPASDFSLSSLLRGGFGGGAGGYSSGPYGAGGGGGGFIQIIAGGDITITFGDSLNVIGGNGGAGGPDGGGGGGGSGGVIWLQTLGNITVDGSLSADGGTGGTAILGAAGGNGGFGVIRLEDIDGVITGLGAGGLPAYVDQIVVSSGASSSSLKSDISCGMIKPAEKKDHAQIFQMIMGFLLVMSASFFIKRLKFFSKSHV